MPPPRFEKLTRREREIMDALFASPGGISADEVRTRLSDPPSYSAVRTMLSRLEEKGAIRHREEGLRYIYEATIPRATARKAALHQLVRIFFDGSPGQTAAALLRNDRWTDEELDALQREIETVRKERKR